jgi:CheY-like chemotaxis protein
MSTKNSGESIVILMADDDCDDRMMTKDALIEARVRNELRFVCDGEELMDYLCHRGEYVDPSTSPKPGLLLLDLNMPRKDGREALEEIKQNPELKCIPIVVLTTSKAEQDIIASYELGVSGYVTKPVSFDGLIEVMKAIGRYWLEIVELPR